MSRRSHGRRGFIFALVLAAMTSLGVSATAADECAEAPCACGQAVCDCESHDAFGLGCGVPCVNLVTPKGGNATGYEALWFRVDYLFWQRTGSDLPPLVTSSPLDTPLGNAGVLELPSTTVVVGDQEVNDGWRSGVFLEGGFWLNPYTGWAISGDYFDAGRDSFGFTGGQSTDEYLARPFFNPAEGPDGAQDAFLVDGVGQFAGTATVTAYDDFEGAGATMQRFVWTRGNACMDRFSGLSVLGGYRYYHHASLLSITEDSTAVTGNDIPGVMPGDRRAIEDLFRGQNDFHGFEIGLQGRVQRQRWWCEGLATVALGTSRRQVFVGGFTSTLIDGVIGGGGGGVLTAEGRNIGERFDNQGAAIPRFRLGAGWQATEKLGFRMGYNLIVWDGVVFAADHLPPNLAVDPDNLPGGDGAGGPQPVFPGIRESTMVAHGLDLGLELAF
jgi:hypothetical protein